MALSVHVQRKLPGCCVNIPKVTSCPRDNCMCLWGLLGFALLLQFEKLVELRSSGTPSGHLLLWHWIKAGSVELHRRSIPAMRVSSEPRALVQFLHHKEQSISSLMCNIDGVIKKTVKKKNADELITWMRTFCNSTTSFFFSFLQHLQKTAEVTTS